MGESTTSFNDLVDAHSEKEDEFESMKAKLADLEDRSRRNNVEIRRYPRVCTAASLKRLLYKTNENLSSWCTASGASHQSHPLFT